jgi:hypothetical protein
LGRTSKTISFRAVKNTVIIVCFAPIACRILEMTSASSHVNFLEQGWRYRNQGSSPVAVLL